MLDKKIYVKIFIIILALLTYKTLSKNYKEKFSEGPSCPKDCEKENDDGTKNGSCDKITGMCECKTGWVGDDCQIPKQLWFAKADTKLKRDATTGLFNCGSKSCLEVFYDRKIPRYWNDKNVPLLEIPSDSFFNVRRQSKWFIDDNGIASKIKYDFDENGSPKLNEDGSYKVIDRYDDNGVLITDQYVGNWSIKDENGNQLKKIEKIPRIFKIKKSEIEQNKQNIHPDWLKEKRKIWIEDPDDKDYYLDVGDVNVNRLKSNYTNIENNVDPLTVNTDQTKRRFLGGIKLMESDINNAKKYAFAKLCISKGYNYFEDPLSGKPKCEFNKEQCLSKSNKESDKPPESDGTREKYSYSEWREGVGCIQVNEIPKKFCEGDHLCSLGKNGFKYDSTNGSCVLTEQYCNTMSLTYDPKRGKCVTKDGQRFAEALGGQSLARASNGCPKYTDIYNTYKTNNMMEQWPNDTQEKITATCMPKQAIKKDKDGKDMVFKCPEGTDPNSIQCKKKGEYIRDPHNLYIEPIKRAKDSVKPWYTDDGVWPWTKNPDEKKLYAQGKLDCNDDSECEKPDNSSEIARAIGGKAGNKICLMHRCMDKRNHTQSCDRDSHCKDGLVCNSKNGLLDGCGWKHGTREEGQSCNFWPECKTKECKPDGEGGNKCGPVNKVARRLSQVGLIAGGAALCGVTAGAGCAVGAAMASAGVADIANEAAGEETSVLTR